jgi:prevent-host-death family protein
MGTRIVPKTELRDRIREELATLGDDTLLVTDRGRPAAVVVSVHRWNELNGALEDLSDARAVLEARLAEERGRPAEAIFSEIEAQEADVRGPTRQTG